VQYDKKGLVSKFPEWQNAYHTCTIRSLNKCPELIATKEEYGCKYT
jgi:hypothetical protein